MMVLVVICWLLVVVLFALLPACQPSFCDDGVDVRRHLSFGAEVAIRSRLLELEFVGVEIADRW